jgi:4a-hydroxytetrahydrobiopterin dehydratase
MNASEFRQKSCRPCAPGTAPLARAQAERWLEAIPGWSLREEEGTLAIERVFRFKNYYETMAFVNALAWIAHREDHHPDLEVGYNRCRVRLSTHAVKGLSENDFICAAKIDALLGEQ